MNKTNEEVAKKIAHRWWSFVEYKPGFLENKITKALKDCDTQARSEERERCAVFVDSLVDKYNDADVIAKAIRNRDSNE